MNNYKQQMNSFVTACLCQARGETRSGYIHVFWINSGDVMVKLWAVFMYTVTRIFEYAKMNPKQWQKYKTPNSAQDI